MKEYKYKINGSIYNVIINGIKDDIAQIEVNGTPYTVEMEPKPKKKLSTPFKKAAQAGAAQPQVSSKVATPMTEKSVSSLKSPLPGIILDIKCSVGDTVKKGQTLIVLEAMKMENNSMANKDGAVTKIMVQKGDSVLEGADLLSIE